MPRILNIVEDVLVRSIAIAVRKDWAEETASSRFNEFVSAASSLTADQWKEFYELSRRHGVSALVFSTVQRLPKEAGVPRELLFSWFAYSESVAKRYSKQCKAASEFAELMSDNGLGVVILKGIGLASKYYPSPELRECGDIDVFVYETDANMQSVSEEYVQPSGYEKCDSIIENLHNHIDRSSDKHSVFTFNGVMVENHKTFVSDSSKSCRLLNSILNRLICSDIGQMQSVEPTVTEPISDSAAMDIDSSAMGSESTETMLESAAMDMESAAMSSESQNGKAGTIVYPGADFNALFLLRHTVTHLAYEGVTLHNIVDWGLFLLKEKGSIDWHSYTEYLKRTRLFSAFAVFTSIAAEVIGADLNELCDPSLFSLIDTSSDTAELSDLKMSSDLHSSSHQQNLSDSRSSTTLSNPQNVSGVSNFGIARFAQLKDRVAEEVMTVRLHKEASLPFFKRLIAKAKRIFSNKWQYGTVNPDNFWFDALLPSIISHIKFPDKI